MWVNGDRYEHLKINVNIDTKGEYYCRLPKSVAERFGQKKVTGQGLHGVVSEAKRLCKEYKAWAEAQSESSS